MNTFLRISGRDPLVARDGRPFGAGQGNRMRSSGWPLPGVVAGSFRTALGKAAGRGFDARTQEELLRIEVAGVLPFADGQLYLPAPQDCVLRRDGGVCRARPEPPRLGEGADWPLAELRPVVLDGEEEDFKPETGPAFWPLNRYTEWLAGKTIDPRSAAFLQAAVEDLRDHVSLTPETGAAEDGLLFTTTGVGALALPRHGRRIEDETKPTGPRRYDRFAEIELTARVSEVPAWGADALARLSTWHPLGGERRLAHWQSRDDEAVWRCPPEVVAALGETNRVALTLATPAVFAHGWRPGWLDEQRSGSPWPGAPRLTLVGVCIQRWRAVSGWSYRDGGPKAIRRVVPAGGVYFFESESSDNRALTGGWLRPVSDGDQERRDGFGLAVWGTW